MKTGAPESEDDDDGLDSNFDRDANEVGCYGLVDGYAIQTNSSQRVFASEVTRLDGPFHCSACLSDAVHRRCTERKDHFAHKARLSPILGKGESELHKRCKEEICAALINEFPDGKWACEREVKANKNKGTPKLVPDISGYIGDQRVVIEVQASRLTVQRIINRANAYRKQKCAVLWIVPLSGPLGEQDFRPRLLERYLHSIYYGRTYYWIQGFGSTVLPVHFGVAYRHIDRTSWYDSSGNLQEAGGYEKPYKIVKTPLPASQLRIGTDFKWVDRGEFIPWNERKTVPELSIWQDILDHWWDIEEQRSFEDFYSEGFD